MSEKLPRHCRECPRAASMGFADLADCPSSPARKAEVRRAITAALASMTPEVRRHKSLRIGRQVAGREEFRRARVVMAYLALELEVDPWSLIREAWSLGKTVVVPRIEPPLEEPRITMIHARRIVPLALEPELVDDPADHAGLQADVFGIHEPKAGAVEVPAGEIDLVMVPAMAIDRHGYRMGKGGGFYDRFLVQEGLRATSCGLVFSEQVFASVLRCPHDRRVDLLVTETGVVDFRKVGR